MLRTQLEVACKLYNTLLHLEQQEYKKNRHTMGKNELRQLALDLRKRNPEFQALHSQVAQQVAERFYQARQRFFEGLANKPRKKKPHMYLSLVYPQKGWKLSDIRGVGQGENKKMRARLYLSKMGFFTVVIHRDFPLGRVCQVCVKLYPSGRMYVVFLVKEEEALNEQAAAGEPRKVVAVDVGVARLATLSDGRFLENPKPLECSLERIRTLQGSLSRKIKFSKNWLKAKRRLAKEYEYVKDFRRDVFFKLDALLAAEYDLLVSEDLNVEGLIRRGETGKRRLRLHDSAFSELRRMLEWGVCKTGESRPSVQLVARVLLVWENKPEFNFGGQSVSLSVLRVHSRSGSQCFSGSFKKGMVGATRSVCPAAELHPIPPLPSLGLKRRKGEAMMREAPSFTGRG